MLSSNNNVPLKLLLNDRGEGGGGGLSRYVCVFSRPVVTLRGRHNPVDAGAVWMFWYFCAPLASLRPAAAAAAAHGKVCVVWRTAAALKRVCLLSLSLCLAGLRFIRRHAGET